MPTLVRAIALIGLAGVIGVGHSMMRDRPIVLDGHRVGAIAPANDPTRNPGTPTGRDPGTPDGPEPGAYDPNAIADMSPEQLLDAGVLEGMITLREASDLYDAGALFLDARHDYEFEAGRVAGAVWMPAAEVFARAAELLAHDPTLPVVIYCTGGACDASHNTANRLINYGPELGLDFADIRIMGLGYEEWQRAGLPTEGDE